MKLGSRLETRYVGVLDVSTSCLPPRTTSCVAIAICNRGQEVSGLPCEGVFFPGAGAAKRKRSSRKFLPAPSILPAILDRGIPQRRPMSSNAGAGAGVPQQLESLLAAFTNPDNETRRRAEAAWEDLKQRLPDEVLRTVGERVAGRETARSTT